MLALLADVLLGQRIRIYRISTGICRAGVEEVGLLARNWGGSIPRDCTSTCPKYCDGTIRLGAFIFSWGMTTRKELCDRIQLGDIVSVSFVDLLYFR
jgi:hypothetical protein